MPPKAPKAITKVTTITEKSKTTTKQEELRELLRSHSSHIMDYKKSLSDISKDIENVINAVLEKGQMKTKLRPTQPHKKDQTPSKPRKEYDLMTGKAKDKLKIKTKGWHVKTHSNYI